eukprot:CAMPEP_0206048668 /NCGR_PEP_ID=MMETSP1466-20131121/24765_1 /ASSEMBLY_ACC=CAM_ASM_001126 /TAXON_ID=44452 /ORGANISM="Pavlova gyrans, Strain CCMP608" /LENGTH=104 /DNA_ID=CAMNT_0053423735 /DNA_START=108 /DNA_END=422 /DNA_ORIENTATION=-
MHAHSHGPTQHFSILVKHLECVCVLGPIIPHLHPRRRWKLQQQFLYSSHLDLERGAVALVVEADIWPHAPGFQPTLDNLRKGWQPPCHHHEQARRDRIAIVCDA